MSAGQTLYDVTEKALRGLQKVLEEAKPDLVLVHGDTTTTFAGALAAFYAQIPVGHVEAGLRTGNKYSPFPEEMNRKLTGALADYHFCAYCDKQSQPAARERAGSKNCSYRQYRYRRFENHR